MNEQFNIYTPRRDESGRIVGMEYGLTPVRSARILDRVVGKNHGWIKDGSKGTIIRFSESDSRSMDHVIFVLWDEKHIGVTDAKFSEIQQLTEESALPVETLMYLGEKDPQLLEQYRCQETEKILNSAPEEHRRKLQGLQFKIDMERRKAKTPMAACLKLAAMMQDSFLKLREALNQIAADNPPKHVSVTSTAKAPATKPTGRKVLPFQPKNKE